MPAINHRSSKWYGWLPDLPDQRDFSYSVIKPRIAKLPGKVDLRKKYPPIENQGDIGSCTAHALVGALEFLEEKIGCRAFTFSVTITPSPRATRALGGRLSSYSR